ncbi:DNA polymerase III subunit epsilon [Guyparkeria halopsychrophila]|uniref:DNA polymerase III subunit epsilon n=1 Tax=Guyparkeria halopsychrophila TaxID=3139421 RepID=UPI0037C7CFE2
MRQIVLDTETTGMPVGEGHRLIEIGAVELVERRLTHRNYHQYLNPERVVDAGAFAVHGLSNDFLQNKPRFAEVVDEFLDYIRGAELVIHNAAFDVGFIDAELKRIGYPPLAEHVDLVTDSLAIARHKHPGQRNSLDALCRRYQVDNSDRTLHGALLDSEILADVYLALTGGQWDLSFDNPAETATGGQAALGTIRNDRPRLRVIAPEAEAVTAHAEWVERLRTADAAFEWPGVGS